MRSFRTRILTGVIAALAVLITPALLLAHARLIRSAPAVDGRLLAPPGAITLWFSEHPEVRFTVLRLVDSTGAVVPLGPVAPVDGEAGGVTASVVGRMTPGKYTIVWRTAAADGHPTNGRYSFLVTQDPRADTAATVSRDSVQAVVAAQVPRKIPNAIVEPTQRVTFSSAMRWAELIALLTLVGAIVFRLFVVREASLRADVRAEAIERTRRLASAVLFLFAITTLWRLAAQSDLLPTAGTARAAAMWSVARNTAWGHGWRVGAFGVLIVVIGLLLAKRAIQGWILAGLGVVLIGVGEGLTGHAAALARHASLATAVDLTHLLAVGGWLGGLVTVVLCGLPAMRGLDTIERRHAGHRLVRSYHRAAVECVTLVLITAAIATWLRLGSIRDLWTTTYGQLVSAKIALVALLLGFGFYHYKTAVERDWDDDTRFRFQRSVVAELVVGAVVVGVTALLVATALPLT